MNKKIYFEGLIEIGMGNAWSNSCAKYRFLAKIYWGKFLAGFTRGCYSIGVKCSQNAFDSRDFARSRPRKGHNLNETYMKLPKFNGGNGSWSGADWHWAKQVCLYGWFRGNHCLYIGKSENGFARFLNKHHVIGVLEPVKATDSFRFIFPKPNGAPDQLKYLEERLIKFYRPLFNRIHNNINHEERTITRKIVPGLPKNLRSQKEMAEVVFDEVQKRLILGDAQDCRNMSTKSLEQRISDTERAMLLADMVYKKK